MDRKGEEEERETHNRKMFPTGLAELKPFTFTDDKQNEMTTNINEDFLPKAAEVRVKDRLHLDVCTIHYLVNEFHVGRSMVVALDTSIK